MKVVKKILFLQLLYLLIIVPSCKNTNVTVADIDGNKYKTVKIEDKIWMAENLKVTHFKNGEPILEIQNDKEWANTNTSAYCNYKNSENNAKKFGKLYNWFAVNDKRGLAPEGWHIPTLEEWQELVNYLGGAKKAAGKLKMKQTKLWDTPNIANYNVSGFNAIGSGDRNNNGFFENIYFSACWWTSTGSPDDYASVVKIYHNSEEINFDIDDKKCGFSIRCIKNKN